MEKKTYQQPKACIFMIQTQQMIAESHVTTKSQESAQEEAYSRGSSTGAWDDDE